MSKSQLESQSVTIIVKDTATIATIVKVSIRVRVTVTITITIFVTGKVTPPPVCQMTTN